MPALKKSLLDNLLEVAAGRAAEAAAKAQKAEAERAEAERAEATEATNNTFSAIADATAKAKEDNGYPGITALMSRLSDYARTGAASTSVDYSALQAERDQAISDKNAAEALLTAVHNASDPTSLAGQLAAARLSNSNQRARIDALEADLAFERDASDPTSLAGKLASTNAGYDEVKDLVADIPFIDLSLVGRGGTVRVPLIDANRINSIREDLRSKFGL